MINMLKADIYKMLRMVSFRTLVIVTAAFCVLSIIFINFSVGITLEYQEKLRNGEITSSDDYTDYHDKLAAEVEDSFQRGLKIGFEAGMQSSIDVSEAQSGQKFVDMDIRYPTVLEMMAVPLNGNIMLAIFACIFTSIFITGEFVHGTMKNTASKGFSRAQLYLSKLAVCIIFSLMLILVYELAMFISASVLFDFGDIKDAKSTQYFVGTLMSLVPYIALVCCSAALAFIIRSGGATAVIIVFCMFGGIITELLSQFFRADLSFLWLGSALNITSQYADKGLTAIAAVIASAVYIAASTAIGIGVFSGKDI